MPAQTTLRILAAVFALSTVALKGDGLKVASATVGEDFRNPMGHNLQDLSFSWKLPLLQNGTAQAAYRVVVASSPDKLPDKPDVWDSGKVVSPQSVKVPYQGPTLQSRDRRYWMVKVWNESGREGEWSDVNHFEVGLKDNTQWKGQWISGDLPLGRKEYVFNRSSLPKGKKAAYDYMKPAYLRKEFEAPRQVARARFYATAKDIYKASLKGKELDSRTQWIPGWTGYGKRIQTDTYDSPRSSNRAATPWACWSETAGTPGNSTASASTIRSHGSSASWRSSTRTAARR